MSPGPALPPPAPDGELSDSVARRQELERRAVKAATRAAGGIGRRHGIGSVALGDLGERGIRLVLVAADGVFGDAGVPTVTAAEQVCRDAGWPISGWDAATVRRISPTPLDRRRMAGTGR